jgi:class 3 adenylate cyclase/tetratricopeptide (TPR) repeat protein
MPEEEQRRYRADAPFRVLHLPYFGYRSVVAEADWSIFVAEPVPQHEHLSARERQIAEAYAAGRSYREIAERLFIAPATVRTHLGTIYRKLGVSTKIELLRTLESDGGETVGLGRAVKEDAARTARTSSPERRQVTVLSALPEGLGDLARSADPEEFAALIEAFRTVVDAAIDRHRGRRLASQSTEVLACFGLPASDETDAERAVRCALNIGTRLSQVRGPDGQPLVACIGLCTGPVVASSASGDTFNLTGSAPLFAAALAREAKGGGIVVCARTHAVLGGLFAFTDLGPIAIDGGPGPVQRFAVGEAIPAETRFEALHGYRLTPFVGRDHEIGLLETLFHRAEVGEGQIAVVSGEPGIGKSRIVRTLFERLALSPEAMLVFQCSPHERSSPLHGVAQTFRQIAHVELFETPSARLEALAALFANAIEEPERDRELLAELTSMRHGPAQGHERLPADKRRAATLALLDRFLCQRAERGPLLVVFEDMHWADPTTEEWLEGVVGLCETLPLLVIATGRPEFAFGPSTAANVTTLALSRLGRAELERIVVQQAPARPLSPAVISRIVERSEGIPLFAEELTRAILELGEAEDAVPTTLQASLMGRLDRLGAAREVAQAAAVIGRDFDADLLAEIVPHDARALNKALDALLAGRLVLRRGGSGGRAFQFKHALVRDAAYESLLRARREALHETLAERLIARREQGSDVAPELIAHHLVAGGMPARSVPFWLAAIDIALVKGAEREGAAFCRFGLQASLSIEDERDRDIARCDLLQLQQGADYSQGDVRHLLAIILEAEECARRLDDPRRLALVLHSKTYNLTNSGRVSEAIEVARQCVEISAKLVVQGPWIMANMMLARSLYSAGRYREAVHQGEIVRDALGEDLERGFTGGDAMNQTVSSRVWLCFMLTELGRFEDAGSNVAKAYELIPHVPANEHVGLWAALAHARLASVTGDHETVLARLAPLADLCEQSYPVYIGRLAMSLGPALVALGQSDEGVDLLERATELSGRQRFSFLRALLLAQFSGALLAVGDATRAAEIARQGIAEAERSGEAGNRAWAQLCAAEAALALGRPVEAKAAIEQAGEEAHQRAMLPLVRRCAEALKALP